jgi:glycosyltransferase involved in cell wall biosynthesis
MSNSFLVSIVIPVYNESGSIGRLIAMLEEELSIYPNYEVIFVDDGCTDNTLELIKVQNKKNQSFNFISLSRNFGHQYALKAGMDYANGDCVISMDGDMQHPIKLVHEMINLWLKGNHVVYTIRKDDENISFFKKNSAWLFYSLINRISDVKIMKGTADFRLIDKKVLEIITSMNEAHLFLRGIVPWVGFQQIGLEYKANERFAGTSKYTLIKMIRFAATGITSFSIKPLQIATGLGFIISFLTFVYGIYATTISFITNTTVSGWTSLIVSVLFIGGVQLIFIGLIGEYIGKIFIQVKNRPNYIIKETTVKKL